MTLKPRESTQTEFIQILKSKHVRYIDGMVVVDKDAVAGDYIPPGSILGKITSSGLYGPVTRDLVDTAGADSARGLFNHEAFFIYFLLNCIIKCTEN